MVELLPSTAPVVDAGVGMIICQVGHHLVERAFAGDNLEDSVTRASKVGVKLDLPVFLDLPNDKPKNCLLRTVRKCST